MANSQITAEFSACMRTCGAPSDKPLAIAVSGGSDSMALLLLMHEWARQHGNKLYALTVDHDLRPESASEAAQVATWCKMLGIEHHTLYWQHEKLQSGVQEKARTARYELMSEWCRARNIEHLFTGHHQDDQIETFLFRLARGSRLEGLSGMLPRSQRHDITLHRPLLSMPKKCLLEYLDEQQQSYVDDASNHQNYYTRNTMRRSISTLSHDHTHRITQLIDSFYKFRKLLEYKLAESLNLCISVDNAGYATLDISAYKTLPALLRKRMLHTLCHTISGNAEPLRSEKIERLDEQLISPSPASKYTIHGVVFIAQPKDGNWLIIREKQKIQNRIPISNKPILWDDRFLVILPHAKEGISIGMLGIASASMRTMLEKSGIPKHVWPTLPALFALEECIAIPHIHRDALLIRFIPAKPLEAERFFAINTEPTFVRKNHCA